MAFDTLYFQGEAFTVLPDGDANAANNNVIRTRTQNQEVAGLNNPGGPANPGLPNYDAFGLNAGYSGAGYLDINGTDTGDQAVISFDAPAGTYEVTVRLANGAAARPITVRADTSAAVIADTVTGQWYQWQTRTVTVVLTSDGPHTLTIGQNGAAGAPNIDAVAIALAGTPVAFDLSADADGNLAAAAPATVATNALGAVAIRLSGVDADIASYAVAIGNGAFAAVTPVPDAGDQVVTLNLSAFAAQSSVAVNLRLTDTTGNLVARAVSIGIVPAANGVPTLSVDATAVTENVVGAVVGTLTASDPEGLPLSFGVSDARLQVVGGTVVLKPGASLNHETDNGATVTVTATDAVGQTATANLVLAVGDVNDAPTLTGSVGNAVVPKTGGTVDLSALVLADEDVGQTPTLGLRGAGGAALPAGITLTGSTVNVAGTVAAGAYQLEAYATDGSLTSAPVGFTVTVQGTFTTLYFQGEAFTVLPDGDANAANNNVIRTRTQNQEVAGLNNPGGPANPGLPNYDAFGLNAGYSGAGYLDINGTDTGDQAVISFDAPAGTYEVTVRLANGAAARPITVRADTSAAVIADTVTGQWYQWQTRTVTVVLTSDGPHTLTIGQNGAAGAPNIDAVAIALAGTPVAFDLSADADGNLAAAAPATVATNALGAVAIRLSGVDADIASYAVAIGNGAFAAVTPVPDAGDQVVTLNLSAFAAQSSVAVNLRLTDTTGNLVARAVSIGIVPAANGVPTLSVDATAVTENVVGAVVGTLTASDPEGLPLSFGVSDARLQVVGGTVVLKPGASLNHETDNGATVTVTATDAVGQTATANLVLAVGDVNDAPTLTGSVGNAVVPKTGGTVDLSALVLADEDVGQTPTLGLRGAGGAALPAGITLTGSTVNVAGTVAAGAYQLEAYATDGSLTSAPVGFTVTVQGTFDTLYFQGEAFTVLPDGDANAANNNVIRTRTQNQEVAGLNNPGGPANPGLPNYDAFGLNAGYSGAGYLDINGTDTGDQAVISFDAPAGTYEVTVRLANGAAARPITVRADTSAAVIADTVTGQWYQWQTRTVTVVLTSDGPHTLTIGQNGAAGAPNIDAVAIALAGTPVAFDLSADADGNLAAAAPATVATNALGAVAIRLSGVDADIASYAVAIGNGAFAAVTPVPDAGDQVVTLNLSAFAAQSSVAVNLRLTDTTGNLVARAVSIGIVPAANGVPTLSVDATAVTENVVGAVVGTLTASDPEGLPLSFGVSDARLQVVGGTVVLKPGASLNHETDNGATVTVTATDAVGQTATANLVLAVGDVNDAPTLTGSVGNAVVPKTGGTVDLSALVLADEDVGQTPTLGLRGAGGAALPAGITLTGSTVNVAGTVAAGAYQLEAYATDGSLTSAPVGFTVTVQGTFTTLYFQGEAFTVLPDGDANAANNNVIRTRTQNQEVAGLNNPGGPANPGLPNYDAFGLNAGYSGAGYLDINGTDTGDQAVISFDAPAGTYEVTVRLANGAAARPITVRADTSAAVIADTVTGQWYQWQTRTVTVVLTSDGPHTLTIGQNGAAGAPNIDAVAIALAGTPVAFDLSADADGNLAAAAPATVATNALGAVAIRLSGVDADIASYAVAIGNGAFAAVTPVPDAGDQVVTLNLSAFAAQSSVAVNLRLTDTTGNLVTRAVSIGIVPAGSSEPGPRETIRVNFQDGSAPKAAGYLVDNFLGFDNRGNGESYGWVTEASATDANGASAVPINGAAYPAQAIEERSGQGTGIDAGRNFDSYDPRLTGFARFDFGTNYPAGDANRAAWELSVANGWYEVSVSVGDTGGPNNNINRLFVEGSLITSWAPTDLFKSQLVTGVVKVEDGFLTVSAQGGSETKVQYLEVRELPDLTPGDGKEAPQDYASFFDARAVAGIGAQQTIVDLDPGDGVRPEGVDPSSDILLAVSIVEGRGGLLLESLQNGAVQLYKTLTGETVSFSANTTGGFDSLTISPLGDLQPNTSYTLVIDGFMDRGLTANPNSPTRELQKFTTTFTTGDLPPVVVPEVAFVDTVELDGAAHGAFTFTSIAMSPDNSFLYVTTLGGQIKRWAVDPQSGAINKASEQTFTPGGDFDTLDGRRGFVGLAFDPANPNTIWVTDNYPIPLSGRDNGVPDFSGRVSKVQLGAGGSLESATISTYVTGLPRSNGDHVTNGLTFRENPNAGQPGEPAHLLYVVQGSNSAMGAADTAWGLRPERLLNAAVLEIDATRTAPAGGFNVVTEPLPNDGLNRRFADPDGNLKNGGIPISNAQDATINGKFLHFAANGVATVRETASASSAIVKQYYDPFATDAVLGIFSTGERNAYDLVWHSNGFLYVPTNGSSAGGRVPDNPTTPQNEGFSNVETQDDFLFRTVGGKYYGHPNPLRNEFVMNGGNPTSAEDKNQVDAYTVGVNPELNYDINGTYSLQTNRSPNGVVEYKSNVFGSNLQNALIISEYSSGDDLRALLLGQDGMPVDDFVIRRPDGSVISYVDPLDVVEGSDGRLYVVTLNRATGESQIVRLDPAPDGGAPAGAVAQAPASGGAVGLLASDAQETVAGVAFAIYEAENAAFNGPLVVNEPRNQSGSFVDYVGTNNQTITWTVNVPETGIYDVDFIYALAASKAARPLSIAVNGTSVGRRPFEGVSNESESSWFPQSAELVLRAGDNTISLTAPQGVGPNIDYLRVSEDPIGGFRPNFAAIYGEDRIEFNEPADFTSRVLSPRAAEFYFAVDASGVYALDLAANPGAPAGAGVSLFLNGDLIGTGSFPGSGQAGETTKLANLVAGTPYELRVVSNQPGANALDYLDVRAVSDSGANIAIQSQDAVYFPERLQFSWLANPFAVNPTFARDYKESAVVRISNTGSANLDFFGATIDGPFALAQPALFNGLTLAPGQSINATVLFLGNTLTRANNVSGVVTGALTLATNDFDRPTAKIDLAGFWQARDEGGFEPNVNEVWEVFGFGTRIVGMPFVDTANTPLDNNDIYAAVNDLEVLSPYWRLADGVTQAKITQIAAFHSGGGAAIGLHAPGSKADADDVILWTHAANNNQSVLPIRNNFTFSTAAITNATIPDSWPGPDIFGIEVDDFSTDPTLNPSGPGFVPPGIQRGHFVRMFKALGPDGFEIPNTYLGIMDYTGINYDYNDNLFLISGVAPAGIDL